MTNTLDVLLEAMETIPLEPVRKRKPSIKQQAKEAIQTISAIENKLDFMLDLYDKVVLQGYISRLDRKIRIKYEGCATCYVRIPSFLPPYKQLLYASSYPNEMSRSISLQEILNRVDRMANEDKTVFLYGLRAKFTENFVSGRVFAGSLSRELEAVNFNVDYAKNYLRMIHWLTNLYQVMSYLIARKQPILDPPVSG